MKLDSGIFTIVTIVAGLLSLCLSGVVLAAGQSSCLTCHLDEAMLLKNLSKVEVKKSALQSGAG
jgi:hypothetical protein